MRWRARQERDRRRSARHRGRPLPPARARARPGGVRTRGTGADRCCPARAAAHAPVPPAAGAPLPGRLSRPLRPRPPPTVRCQRPSPPANEQLSLALQLGGEPGVSFTLLCHADAQPRAFPVKRAGHPAALRRNHSELPIIEVGELAFRVVSRLEQLRPVVRADRVDQPLPRLPPIRQTWLGHRSSSLAGPSSSYWSGEQSTTARVSAARRAVAQVPNRALTTLAGGHWPSFRRRRARAPRRRAWVRDQS